MSLLSKRSRTLPNHCQADLVKLLPLSLSPSLAFSSTPCLTFQYVILSAKERHAQLLTSFSPRLCSMLADWSNQSSLNSSDPKPQQATTSFTINDIQEKVKTKRGEGEKNSINAERVCVCVYYNLESESLLSKGCQTTCPPFPRSFFSISPGSSSLTGKSKRFLSKLPTNSIKEA